MSLDTVKVQNIPFQNYNFDEFMAAFEERIDTEQKTFVVTANPELVMAANRDPKYLQILQEADYITPDGIGVVIASKLLKTPLKERVAGFDLMNALLKHAQEKGLKVYLLGAKEKTLEKAYHKMKEQLPELNIVGRHHGYFDISDEQIANEIANLEPDLVFVALGFPKQEYWIHQHLHRFQKGLFMGIGGSFDVWAGEMKRAPQLLINLHMEWLYRLFKQPTRWRRMLVLPQFLLKVMKEGK